MLMKTLAVAIALIAPASMCAAAPIDDAKCLILSNGFTKQASTPKLKEVAMLTRYYYLGRLSGVAASGKLAGLIVQARKTVTSARSSAEMTACAATLQTSERALIAAGTEARNELGSPK